ncbi:aromatic acid/H+ symport family MFS transporter [Micromonospora sp. NPDC047738]|uniref:MFS transporter n=1 Tax=Micromonospora sp. NPDC047738 TaxID=3155741 RepID=UPI0033F35C32
MTPTTTVPQTRRSAALVTALCWVIVVFDGYDLIVYGTVLPRLLQEPGWHLTKAGAGLLGSLAFAGMLVGAVFAGALADRLGRRTTIIACTAWFSVFTALCAVAPNPEVFGLLRLVAGLGLGGLVPSANALTAEYVRVRNRSMVSTLMMSGIPIGGVAASLVGMQVLPSFGWRAMFVIALLGGLVVVALAVRFLPESPIWLRTRGRTDEAAALEAQFGIEPQHEGPAAQTRQPLRSLLRPPFSVSTVLFSLATVATLFAWYGLATWLPQLMRESGFDLGGALTFLLALNLGAVLGSLVTAYAGARIGPVKAAAFAAAVAAIGLGVLLSHPSSGVGYLALVLAGVGTHGTQCLIIAAVANHYPARLRGSALGFSLGFGRIGAVAAPQVGGWLLAAGLGVDSNFLAFALAAAVAGVLLFAFPRRMHHAHTPATDLEPEGATA